ncbi:MAG: AsmA family protein, partial [Steroidobacteraceae bacterium]
SLPGKIELSIFPWVAVQFGPASLGNPPGFGSQPFASVQRASLRVRLLPLLHKQLQVGRVEVDGLDLHLLKNAQGRANWEMSQSGAKPTETSGPGAVSLQGIAGVVVRNSRVSYQDMVADHLNIDVGRVAQGVAVPIKWSLDLATAPGARPIPISGGASFEYGGNTAKLSGLDARLDDSTVRGDAALTNLTTGALRFDLSIDHFDLDRYRTPQVASAKSSAATATQLPLDALKGLDVDGKVSIGSATVSGVKLSQVSVGLADHGNVAHFAPIAAQLYGGRYTGDVTIDDRGAEPALHLDQQMQGIRIEPLLQDFAHQRRISGQGNVATNLTARGRTTDQLIRTLDGHVTANLANGAINGIDLWSAINGAIAVAQRKGLPSGGVGGSTKFDAFKVSADLTNGVASTHDLDIASGDLHVTGQGTTNLNTGAVDYRLNATVLKGAAGAAGAGTLASIPLLVSGTMTSPSVRPDVQGLAKSLAQRELEKHKGELKQKLQNALKGLFH